MAASNFHGSFTNVNINGSSDDNDVLDKWEPITMSPNTSKESKTMISENISVLFSPTSRSPEGKAVYFARKPRNVVCL